MKEREKEREQEEREREQSEQIYKVVGVDVPLLAVFALLITTIAAATNQ